MQVMTMIIHCVLALMYTIFSAMRWIQEMKSERIIITQDIVNNA
jgi:hypothetical protein